MSEFKLGEMHLMGVAVLSDYYTRELPDGTGTARFSKPDGFSSEMIWERGKLHNPHGPAYSSKDGSGECTELYCVHGKLHREDGPAFVRWDLQGNRVEEYYFNGEYVGQPGRAVIRGVGEAPPPTMH